MRICVVDTIRNIDKALDTLKRTSSEVNLHKRTAGAMEFLPIDCLELHMTGRAFDLALVNDEVWRGLSGGKRSELRHLLMCSTANVLFTVPDSLVKGYCQ